MGIDPARLDGPTILVACGYIAGLVVQNVGLLVIRLTGLTVRASDPAEIGFRVAAAALIDDVLHDTAHFLGSLGRQDFAHDGRFKFLDDLAVAVRQRNGGVPKRPGTTSTPGAQRPARRSAWSRRG